MKKRILSLALASAMAVGTVGGAFAETEVVAEVKSSPQYINGYTDGTFRSVSHVSRAEIAKMVAMIQGLEETEESFDDVPDTHWAAGFIGAVQEAGIVEGDDLGNFNPTEGLTRAELATIVSRVIEDSEGEGTEFSDVEGHWAADAIAKVSAAGIINGYPDGSFKPNASVTRAESVKMLNAGLLGMLEIEDGAVSSNVENPFSDDLGWAAEHILAASTEFEYTLEDGKLVVETETPIVEGLAVESVSAITATSVTVSIAELEEDLADATVTVKDGSGKVYAVTPMDLKAGATSATFNFVTPLTVNATSQWTVNGVKYAPENFEIIDVESLTRSGKYLQVTFNSELDALASSEVRVRDKSTLEAYGVESVELSADKMSAKVTMLGDETLGVLAAGSIYTLSITQDGEVTSSDFEIPNIAEEEYVTDIDSEERTITLQTAGVVDIPEDMAFDFEEALGRKATVWYDKNGDVTKFVLIDQTVKYDAVEITTDSSSNLQVKFESDDSEVRLATANAIDRENNNGSVALANGQKYEYAKVVLNSSNRVESIVVVDAFDGDILVESVDGDIVQGYEDEVNLEDYKIVKDGKTISTSDIVAGDLVYYNVTGEFAEVYNNSVTGEITAIFNGEFEVAGGVYDIAGAKVVEDGEVRALEQDDLEELQAGGEVKVYLNRKGDVTIVTGDFGEVTTANVGSYLDKDALVYFQATRPNMEIQYVTTGSDVELETVRVDLLEEITVDGTTYEVGEDFPGTSTEIDSFQYGKTAGSALSTNDSDIEDIVAVDGSGTIINGSNVIVDIQSGDLDEGKVVEVIKDSTGNTVGFELNTSEYANVDFGADTDDWLELTDTYVEISVGVNKLIKSSTPVFFTETDEDVVATTWGELSGFDKISDIEVYYDGADVTYLVIDDANTDSEETLVNSAAVVTEVRTYASGDLARITAFVNGETVTYNVSDDDNVAVNGVTEDSIAQITVDENTGKLKSVATAVATKTVSGQATNVNTASKEFTVVDSGLTSTELQGSSKLAVYELDGGTVTKVGISNLSTAANNKNVVTAYRAAEGSKYVDIILINKDAATVNYVATAAAETAVSNYEALALANDANIATAVASKAGAKEGATAAVAALPAGATKTAFEARIAAKDAAIDTAATVATVTVADVNIGNGAGTTVGVTAVAKNAAGVTLTTGVTYAWTVESATDAATVVNTAAVGDLAFSADVVSPTITKAGAADVGDTYGIKVVATKNAVNVNGTATVTVN